jgi:hypothetical protein
LRRALVADAAHMLGGFIVGLVPFAAAHVLVHGLAPGGYLGVVASRGFQWRLIAFNWVSLAVGPRPLFPQGVGMEVVFPWLLPGIGGAALAIGAGRGRAVAANLIVAGTVCLYWLLYLSYPDIHAYGLWRYSNVHYFKWTLLFLAFWAFLLLRALILRGHRAAATAALLAAALLFCWRPVFVPDSKGSETTDTVQAAVPPGLSPMNRAVILPAHGTSFDLFFGRSKLRIGDQVFTNTFDFKLFPDGAAMLMLPLRVLPPGAASLTLAPGVSLPRASTWLAGTTDLQFGVPCFVTPRLSDCKPRPEALQPLPEP